MHDNRLHHILRTLAFCALGIAALPLMAAPPKQPQVALAPAPQAIAQELEPLEVHQRTSLVIVEQLRDEHYLKKPLDDSISSAVFDNYIESLDPGRAYFLESDIRELEKYRTTLDEALLRGDLEAAFKIFNRHHERLLQRLEFLLSELESGIGNMRFDLDDQLQIDRSEAPWPKTTAEADALWRQRLKAAVLGMKLNGKPIEEIGTLLTKRYKNRLKQASQTKSEDAFQLYVNAFATTYDPHTQYFSPRTSQNFNINMSLSLEGIGAVLRTDDDYTEIVRLVPAGPADKSGLLNPADRIVSVGQGTNGPLIDVIGWRIDDVVELIRGPKGTEVRLEVIPHNVDDDATKIVTIERNTVKLEEQAAQKKLMTLNLGEREYKFGVIEIPTFYVDFKGIQRRDPNYRSTTRDVRAIIDELKADQVDGIIIDLRNNGGGSLQEADSLTGLFIESGPTVQVKSKRRNPDVYTDNDDSVAWDGPLAVLVNRLSASASEIFAGAIQDYERGLIIGSQTFGKGTVQTLIPLNRGQLKVTAAKFYRVSGQSTQHQGVLPDVSFPHIFDPETIGESTLDGAMPWDVIQPAIYNRSQQIRPLLNALNDSHRRRVASDVEFQYFNQLAAKSKENNDKEYLSLNESTRKREKLEDDQWRLDLENSLRAARGEPPFKTIDEWEDYEEAAAEDDTDLEIDAMAKESARVLLDYISMTQRIAAVEGQSLGEVTP